MCVRVCVCVCVYVCVCVCVCVSLNPFAHHARDTLAGDCTLLVINQVPKWLQVKDMPASLSLELLDAALQCQPDMVKRTPQLLQVVQGRVCPVLQSMLLKPPLFPVCIRCLRLVSRCVSRVCTCVRVYVCTCVRVYVCTCVHGCPFLPNHPSKPARLPPPPPLPPPHYVSAASSCCTA